MIVSFVWGDMSKMILFTPGRRPRDDPVKGKNAKKTTQVTLDVRSFHQLTFYRGTNSKLLLVVMP